MKNCIVGIVVGIFGIGMGIYGAWQTKKVNDSMKRVNKAIDDLADAQPVDVSDAIVETAVNKAVEREAKTKVSNATNTAVANVNEEIHKEIRAAVKAEYDRLSKDISDRMSKQASEIDMEAFKKEIEKKAEKAVLEKFYKMGGIPKVYGMFANAMDAGSSMLNNGAIKDILECFPEYRREDVFRAWLNKMSTNDVPW